MTKNKYLISVIFFLTLSLLVIVRNILGKNYSDFIWFCDFVPFLLLIGFLFKDEQFIKGLINIGLFSQIVSFILLFCAVFLGINILEFANILKYSGFHIFVSLVLHAFSVNVALLLTYKEKPTKKSLFYSLLVLLIMLIITVIFTSQSENINYVYDLNFFNIVVPYHPFFWIALAFIIVVLPTYGIQLLIYSFTKKKTRIS
jgi:hypothetical protein